MRSACLAIVAFTVMAGTWSVAATARPATPLGYRTDTRAVGEARFRPLAAIDAFLGVTLVIDGIAVATDARPGETVADLLHEADIEVSSGDRLSVGLGQPLLPGLRIVLERGLPVTVVDGGTPIALRAKPGTVGDFLEQAGIALGPNDRLGVDAAAPVAAGEVIGIDRISETTAAETLPVNAPTQTVGDPDQYVGWSRVEVAGVAGQSRVTFLIHKVNGVETERRIVATEPLVAPVAEIVRVGTKLRPAPPPPGEIATIIRAAADKYGVDPEQLLRVAYCESRYDPLAYNSVLGASGLFQIIPGTWRANSAAAGYGGASVFDPVANANVAAFMFRAGQAGQWVCK